MRGNGRTERRQWEATNVPPVARHILYVFHLLCFHLSIQSLRRDSELSSYKGICIVPSLASSCISPPLNVEGAMSDTGARRSSRVAQACFENRLFDQCYHRKPALCKWGISGLHPGPRAGKGYWIYHRYQRSPSSCER